MVPLFISVAAFIWLFNIVDGVTTPIYDQWIGRRIPARAVAANLRRVGFERRPNLRIRQRREHDEGEKAAGYGLITLIVR